MEEATASIKKYIDSEEEDIIKDVFVEILLREPSFVNLVIEGCNVLTAVNFTNADVVLQLYRTNIYLEDPKQTAKFVKKNATTVSFQQLCNSELLEKISLQGLKELPANYDPFFTVLLDYLTDVQTHQKAINKYKNKPGGDEAGMAVILVQHLFSRLIPGHGYVAHNRSQKPVLCPCGCQSKIETGNTSIGSSKTWHGYADILLNGTIPVSLFKDDSENDEDSSDNISDTSMEEPPRKKRRNKNGDQQTSTSSRNETESFASGKNVLMNLQTVNHLIAETITNGFARINEDASLSGWLIPTIGCTSENVIIFMYDPVNDILLQSCEIIPLWNGPALSIHSVVKIWMLLNFTVFTNPNLATNYRLNKSNFHPLAGDRLDEYKKISCEKQVSFCDDEFYEFVMPYVKTFGERAKRVQK